MRIFEVEGIEAIEMWADIIDPICEIASDETLVKCIETKQNIKAVKFALKNHPKQILELMAICDTGVPVEKYKPNFVEIPTKLLEILNNPDISRLFISQVQTTEPYFGSAMENTEAQEKEKETSYGM